MFGGRSFIFGVLYYTVISIAIILFASPLFRVLGYEYAGLISLALSMHILFFSSEKASRERKSHTSDLFVKLSLPALFFSTLPLIYSLASAIIITNCDLLHGILSYIQIVYPTAAIAMLLGFHIGWVREKALSRRLECILFWVLSLLISFAPGYFFAQIFCYGWQYGYFPGFIWDPALELQPAYWWSRLLELLFAIILSSKNITEYRRNPPPPPEDGEIIISRKFEAKIIAVIIAIPLVLVYYLLLWADIIVPQHTVNDALRVPTIMEVSNIEMRFADGSMTQEEDIYYSYLAKLYREDIEIFFDIPRRYDSTDRTFIYIYPDADAMYKYVGTANASIAKPWMNELHIVKGNLHSLRHELVHALLAPYGNFPFDISWSTGLTEGAAVAVEENYDGIRDCDEYAARILQLGLATGIQDIMTFTGFAAQASGKSYTLAGSFSKYLIKQYGSEKFLSLYNTRDYDGIYGKPVEALEREWITSLRPLQTPMSHYDSLRTRFYFDRTSIINEPCLRRIGRMMKQANELYQRGLYNESADTYHDILIEDPENLGALRGKTLSMLQINDPSEALKTVSEAQGRNASVLHTLKADCMIFNGNDTAEAMEEWHRAMKLELSQGSVLSAYTRFYYLAKLDSTVLKRTLRALYSPELSASDITNTLVMLKPDTSLFYQRIGYDIMLYRLCREAGKIHDALTYANDALMIFEKTDAVNDRPSQIVKRAFEDFIRKARPAMKVRS